MSLIITHHSPRILHHQPRDLIAGPLMLLQPVVLGKPSQSQSFMVALSFMVRMYVAQLRVDLVKLAVDVVPCWSQCQVVRISLEVRRMSGSRVIHVLPVTPPCRLCGRDNLLSMVLKYAQLSWCPAVTYNVHCEFISFNFDQIELYLYRQSYRSAVPNVT